MTGIDSCLFAMHGIFKGKSANKYLIFVSRFMCSLIGNQAPPMPHYQIGVQINKSLSMYLAAKYLMDKKTTKYDSIW